MMPGPNPLPQVPHACLAPYLPARSSREIVQCGVTADGDVLQLIGRGIYLGNDNVLVVLIALTQLLPSSRHLLAVGAPRRICVTGTVLGGHPG